MEVCNTNIQANKNLKTWQLFHNFKQLKMWKFYTLWAYYNVLH